MSKCSHFEFYAFCLQLVLYPLQHLFVVVTNHDFVVVCVNRLQSFDGGRCAFSMFWLTQDLKFSITLDRLLETC